MSGHFDRNTKEALTDSRLLDTEGRQSRWNEGAAAFWDTLELPPQRVRPFAATR